MICGIHGIIQSIILFRSVRSDTGNEFLSFYIFSFSVILLENAFKVVEGGFQLPTFISLPFLFSGFTLYLYARTITTSKPSLRSIAYHAIPFALVTVILLISYLFEGMGWSTSFFTRDPLINNIVLNLSGVIHLLLYISLSYRELQRYKKISGYASVKITWISFLVATSLIICVSALVILSLIVLWQGKVSLVWLAVPVWVIMTLLIFSLGYTSLRSPEVFHRTASQTFRDLSTFVKYRNTEIPAGQFQDLIARIELLLTREKVYKLPEMTLSEFAKRVELRPNVLSRIINEYYKMNFNQLLNEYRLRETQMMLQDPQFDKYSILGIALEAGFKSKSSFNSIFKEKLQQSPKDFRKQKLQVD